MKSLIYLIISILIIICLSFSCGNISLDGKEMNVRIKKIDTLESYYAIRFEELTNPCDKTLILKKDDQGKMQLDSIFAEKIEQIPTDIMAPFGAMQVELEKSVIWSKLEYGERCKPKLFQIIDSQEIVEDKMSVFSDLLFVGEY